MKYALIVSCVLFLGVSLPNASIAQDTAQEQTPYWYVSYYSIDWTRTDSLTKLWRLTEPVRQLRKQNGEILEWLGLVHDTGNEHNVVIMTKYPSWGAMRAESQAFETVFTNAAERARLNDGFNWVFGGGPHQDVIYSEAPGSVMPSPEDSTGGAYWYASFYEIPWARVDSLNTLREMTAAVPVEAMSNGSILGTLTLIHHTGVRHDNVVVMTKYPSWEALEARSWGGAFRTVEPDSSRRTEINSGYGSVFTGTPHYDVVYTQPTR